MSKSRKIKKEQWFIAEKAEITHYLFAASPIKSITCEMEEIGFPSLTHSGTEYIKDSGNYIFVRKEWQGAALKYLKKIIKNPQILFKIHKETIQYSDKLFKYGKDLLKKDFKKYTNRKLADFYDKFEYLHSITHLRRVPMWIMETSDNIFSKYLIHYLDRIIKKQKLDLVADTVFAALSTPQKRNFASEEKEAFLKIAQKLKSKRNLTSFFIKERLKNHIKTYCWLPYGVSGPAWNEKYFIRAMKEILKKPKDEIKEEINKIRDQQLKIKQEQERILAKLKIDKLHQQLIKLAQEAIYVKAYSKDALFFGYWAAEGLFREIARRLGINLQLLRHMLPWEIRPALLKGKCDKEELKKRWQYSLHYVKIGKSKVFIGKKAKNFVAKMNLAREEKIETYVSEIKGSCAQPGKAKGKAKIINYPHEMDKMKDGDILVSHMTNPEIVAAMKKASAIITDLGGITCHAAIVSRELKIPCVIGTKIATKALKDGDEVFVDATQGEVKRIK